MAMATSSSSRFVTGKSAVVDGQDLPGDAVDRLSVAGFGAEFDQAARDQAHAHQVEIDEVVEVAAVAGVAVDSAVHDALNVLRPIHVDLDALVRQIGAFRPNLRSGASD